jgi:hypothetical protein
VGRDNQKHGPKLKNKKYAVIKPNNVSTTIQLAATHADTFLGIFDYLARRFKGPVYLYVGVPLVDFDLHG